MEVFVVRHTPVSVGKDTCYGQSDVTLADSFLADFESLKTKLPTDFDGIYVSPMQRCQIFGERIADNFETDERLLEVNFGDWELKKWSEIDPDALDKWMNNFVTEAPPNGESLADLAKRVTRFMDYLRPKKHEKVVLVTHAGVIRCIWAYLLDVPLHNVFKIPVDCGSVLRFKLGENPLFDSIK